MGDPGRQQHGGRPAGAAGAVVTGPIPTITGAIPVIGPPLQDQALEDEIELVSELVAAATESDQPLTREQIDRALGLG